MGPFNLGTAAGNHQLTSRCFIIQREDDSRAGRLYILWIFYISYTQYGQ